MAKKYLYNSKQIPLIVSEYQQTLKKSSNRIDVIDDMIFRLNILKDKRKNKSIRMYEYRQKKCLFLRQLIHLVNNSDNKWEFKYKYLTSKNQFSLYFYCNKQIRHISHLYKEQVVGLTIKSKTYINMLRSYYLVRVMGQLKDKNN